MKVYNTGRASWEYGEKVPGEHHVLLGPCPACGAACFDYGGGWRCVMPYCSKSANNPASTVGEAPDWWLDDINVRLDGTAWCATYENFKNLQESHAGFGSSPDAAVNALRATCDECQGLSLRETDEGPVQCIFCIDS